MIRQTYTLPRSPFLTFFFFKSIFFQRRKNTGLFGKGLRVLIWHMHHPQILIKALTAAMPSSYKCLRQGIAEPRYRTFLMSYMVVHYSTNHNLVLRVLANNISKVMIFLCISIYLFIYLFI